MTSTTMTTDQIEEGLAAATFTRLDSARAALRQAEAEHVETENRRATFVSILKAGDSLPKGKSLAGVEDELSLSAIRIEGLAEQLSRIEEEHALAVADEVAQEVRELVAPLASGERTDEAVKAIGRLLMEIAEEQSDANAVLRTTRAKLTKLPEARFGRFRRVGSVGLDPSRPYSGLRIDGVGYTNKTPKDVIADVLQKAERLAQRHIHSMT